METKETKEVNIVTPEGYEIDRDNSTLERIVFKKKSDGRPRTWEEYANNADVFGKYYIDGIGTSIVKIYKHLIPASNKKNVCDTKEEAEAFLALMQLRQLRKAWVGDWKPDWLSDEYKYVIVAAMDGICINETYYDNGCLSFPTNKMAIEFMKCFEDLLKQAKMLL